MYLVQYYSRSTQYSRTAAFLQPRGYTYGCMTSYGVLEYCTPAYRVYVDPIRFHQNDVIIRSHILILHVDRNVKQYSSTTVT